MFICLFINLSGYPGLSCSMWALHCGMWDAGIPNQGSNPGPLRWEHKVLATGKSS